MGFVNPLTLWADHTGLALGGGYADEVMRAAARGKGTL
jgi:hypothetical protein